MSTRPPSLIFTGQSRSTLRNVHVPGSGVGSRSIFVRRALSRKAATPRDPIPIIITESNNELILIIGGGLTIDKIYVTAGTYNTTTFLTALNSAINSEINDAGLGAYPVTVTYNTSTYKFKFVQSRDNEGVYGGGIRIKNCSMKNILGFNTLLVLDSFPSAAVESFESQVAVAYRP